MNDEKSTIYVPSKHLGLIIGKGGSRIKEISEECGCRINIKKDQANGDDEVPIVLEGSERNIDRAKSKIDEITRRDRRRNPNECDNSEWERSSYSSSNNTNNNNNISSHSGSNGGYNMNQSRTTTNGGQWSGNGGRDSEDERPRLTSSQRGGGGRGSWMRDSRHSGGADNGAASSRSAMEAESWAGSTGAASRSSGVSGKMEADSWAGSAGGASRSSAVSAKVDSEDWGGWGKKSDEAVPLDSLIFSENEPLYNGNDRFGGGVYKDDDDDWGIPTSLDEEKPVRKRPTNAQLKMKSSRDSAFYPVHKHFYREHPNVARMSVDERDEFLKFKNNIMIKEIKSECGASFCNFGDTKFDKDPEELIEELEVSKTIPNPIRTFEEAFFDHPDILREIRKQKFDEPSPIQCIAWPVLMSGRDFIGIAQTGTGKTLAFLLPAFIHIEGQPKPRERRQGPTVLILSPTRELAIQIQNEVQKYTYHDIDSVVCYGGADKRDQIYQLKENPEIVVGTPGRIQDLKDSGVLHLKDVSYLVLDEADRMLDMGFELQVVNLIYAVRKQRQTVMTSATWPFGVQRIALNHMRDPVQVNVGTLDLNACHTVTQYVEYVEYHDKTARLVEILSNIKPEDKIIIFVARKAQCSELAFDLFLKRSKGLLGKKGAVRACEIHGDLDQQEREMALKMMRSGQRNVMIATDVASRGLDIVDLTKVINYDFPKNIEEYVHRVGRTGRAGRTGEAFTFMNKMDWSNATELIKILQDGDQEVPDFLPNLMREYQEYRITGGSRGRFGGGGRGGRGGGGGSGGYSGGGGNGGYNGDRDRDRDRDRDGGGQRRGGNHHRANRFDDNMEDVLTDSSWPDTTNSSVTPFKASSQSYVENDLSDEETWGNWNVTFVNKEKEQDNKIVNEEKKVEIPLKSNVIVSTNKRFSTTPYLLGNKDRNIYPIHRNFYEEHPVVKELSMSEIESFLLKKNNIMIQELKTYPNQLTDNHDIMTDDIDEDQIEILAGNPGIPKPIRTFEEMFWNQTEILDIIKSLKFESPSPIQCVGWPVIMGGRDFIGIAQTGTGKTLTFVLPALIHIEGQIKPRQYRRGPTVLILSPTRELALQIENEILKIKYRGIKSVCCYGGAEKNSQINSLRENPEIVVGTPGRINDLMLMGCLCLKDVSYLVLDEADRMLDMGFEPQVVCIINETRKQRQTIMTSATWPEIVRQIALLYMDNPIQVNVGSLDLIACNAVVQEIRYVNNFSKTDELIKIISEMDKDDKVIVFVTRKIQCRSLTKHLERLVSKNQLGPYANICEIHGDLSQEQREQSLYWFRNGQCTVLVATNVASRGLDIADITCVVNYDFPKDIEEYVHRVGRTGRAGKTGRAITFMNEADWKYSFELKNILIQSDQIVPPWLTNLKHMKITEQLNQSQNYPDENPPSRRNFKTTIKNHWSSLDCNYDDDYDDYDGTEIDFFDEYQQHYDSKNFLVESQTKEVSNRQNNMENNSQENPKEKEDSKCIVEQVIEYRSDFYSELYEQEDESDFFSEYQHQVDPQSEKMPVDEAVNEDEMEYESEDQYEAWW